MTDNAQPAIVLPDRILRASAVPGASYTLSFHGTTKERARELVQLIGGPFQKYNRDGTYWLSQSGEENGSKWQITIFIPGICQKVQTGEIHCQEIVIPACTLPTFEYTCEPLFDTETAEGEVIYG